MSVDIGASGATLDYEQLVDNAATELRSNLAAVDVRGVLVFIEELAQAGKIACYGVGREGLAMRGFAMRLFHMGLRVSVVGEMSASPVGNGDLLLVSAGPGYFSTVSALSAEAQRAGAKVIAFTSQPPSPLQDFADICLRIPATCLPPVTLLGEDPSHLHRTGGSDGRHSILPMGSSYELALQLFFDIICLMLQNKLGIDSGQMKARHTNLE